MTQPSDTVDVSIIVVTYNSSDLISGLLDSLPKALGDLSYLTVVVDNGSADGTADLVEQRGDCRVVRAQNHGYSAGINAGIRAAGESRSILVLNPDVELDAGSVVHMMNELRKPGVGIVVPTIRDGAGALQWSLRRDPSILRSIGLGSTNHPIFAEHLGKLEDYAAVRTVDWATGAVMLISAECNEAVGAWDESFFLYSEETDFMLRARSKGYATRFVPEAVAVHIGQASGYSDFNHSLMVVNRVRFYRRNHHVIAAAFYMAANIAYETAWWLFKGAKHSRAAVLALLIPSRRPTQLGDTGGLIPR